MVEKKINKFKAIYSFLYCCIKVFHFSYCAAEGSTLNKSRVNDIRLLSILMSSAIIATAAYLYVWNRSVYYFSYSAFFACSCSLSYFVHLSISFFLSYFFSLSLHKITHWCCNGKEMHNKDRTHRAIKIVHHQFKINKRNEEPEYKV